MGIFFMGFPPALVAASPGLATCKLTAPAVPATSFTAQMAVTWRQKSQEDVAGV